MVVGTLNKKNIFVSLAFSLVFSFLYFKLDVKYFTFASFGLIGTIITFYNINFGIALGIVIAPFIKEELMLIYLIFVSFVFIITLIYKKDFYLYKNFIHIPIILYLVLIVIATFTSINISGSFRDLAIHLSAISFVFVMINSIKTKQSFNNLLSILVFTATIVALYGIFQYIVGVDIEKKWVDVTNNPEIKTRVFSVFGNPNILAEYLIMCTPISIALFWNTKKLFKKVIFLVTTLILFITIVLTFSRGGWIGFAFGIFVFVILVEKKLLLSLIPISLISVFILPQSIVSRIQTIGSLKDSSNAYRVKIWKITLDVIRDHWITGVGFGYIPFKQTFETYIRTMPVYHAHNTFLETIAEVGFTGFIIFSIMLFVIYKYGIKTIKVTEDKFIKVVMAGLLASFSSILFHGLVESVLYLPKIIITFWIIVGFIIVAFKLKDNINIASRR